MGEKGEVSLLPWAGVNGIHKVGNILIRPFKGLRIQEPGVRSHLADIFKSFVDHTGNPVNSVTLCIHQDARFKRLTEDQRAEVRRAVDAYTFSTICPAIRNAFRLNNRSIGPPSADRFDLQTLAFDPGEQDISVSEGTLTTAGWKVGEIKFPMPFSMGGGFGVTNDDLLCAFDRLETANIDPEETPRIYRSLEWFRLAHVETHHVSELSKVVMMGMAFETLLNLSDSGPKKQPFAEYLETNCCTTESIKVTRTNVPHKVGGRSTRADKTYPQMSWWAWDFYDLRNAIAHGDPIAPERLCHDAPSRPWVSQLIVADLAFYEILIRKLFALNLYEAEFKREVDTDEPSLAVACTNVVLSFNDVHRALGWLPPLSDLDSP